MSNIQVSKQPITEDKQADTLQGVTAAEDISIDGISNDQEANNSTSSQPAKFTEEHPAPTPPPEDMSPSENPISEHQAKYALTSIRNIKRLKDSKPFIFPVDPVALNIPQYYHYFTLMLKNSMLTLR
ncbi:hypothetical protein QEN19_002681 [Hanseniaspora menglaensis]